MRVLVVDDSLTMRRIVIDTIRSFADVEILEAATAEEAHETLTRAPAIGLVLLDHHLPGISGLELLRRLRQDPRTAAIPVVMVTSEREKAHVIAALRAGANNYIVKPFTQQVFKKKIGALLSAPASAGASSGRLVGSIGQTSPLEVIQLIAMTKKTGVLEFESQGRRFEIFFSAGKIEHARGPAGEGEEAIAGAVALGDGVFAFKTEAPEHPVTVRRSTEMIMLEAFSKPAP